MKKYKFTVSFTVPQAARKAAEEVAGSLYRVLENRFAMFPVELDKTCEEIDVPENEG